MRRSRPNKPRTPREDAGRKAPDKYCSVQDVADRLGVCRYTVRGLIFGTARSPALLPHIRVGTAIRIPVDAVESYLSEHTTLGVQ